MHTRGLARTAAHAAQLTWPQEAGEMGMAVGHAHPLRLLCLLGYHDVSLPQQLAAKTVSGNPDNSCVIAP